MKLHVKWITCMYLAGSYILFDNLAYEGIQNFITDSVRRRASYPPERTEKTKMTGATYTQRRMDVVELTV